MNSQERINLLDMLSINEIEHFGRPLREHLIGTHDLLERWGCSEDLCVAGLFHSVYGTKTFKSVSLATNHRQRLHSLIGDNAELLVYIFCMSDRKKLLMENRSTPFFWVNHINHDRTELSREVLADLVELEAANYVEQLPFGTVKTEAVFHDMQTRFESAESLMSTTAGEAVQEAIEGHTHLFASCANQDS